MIACYISAVFQSRNVKRMVIIIMLCIVSLLMFTIILPTFAENEPLISLSETELSLAKGKNGKIIATIGNVDNPKDVSLLWSSSDEGVATVNKGIVQAIGVGTATITCSSVLDNVVQLEAKVIVTVYIPVNGIKIQTSNNSFVTMDEPLTIEYSITPEDATNTNVEWSSSDDSVATVSEQGVVTAVKAGKAVIEVKATDGSNKSAKLNIVVPAIKSGEYTFDLSEPGSKKLDIVFCGEDWEKDVVIKGTNASDNISFSKTGNHTVTATFTPVVAEQSKITITDKKNPKAKISIELNVEKSAIVPSYYLWIKSAKLKTQWGYSGVSVQMINQTDKVIDTACFYVDSYDDEGKQVYYYYPTSNYLDNELFFGGNIKSGKPQTWFSSPCDEYSVLGTAKVRIALRQIDYKDGTSYIIPDNQLCWYEINTGYTSNPDVKVPYQMPDKEVFVKNNKFTFGLIYCNVSGYLSKQFVSSDQGGVWVYSVNRDSYADKSGLLEGDLIIGIDELSYADEPYIMEIAKARMYDGQSVTLHLIRNGQLVDIEGTY